MISVGQYGVIGSIRDEIAIMRSVRQSKCSKISPQFYRKSADNSVCRGLKWSEFHLMVDLQQENLKLKQTVKSLLARIEENQKIDRHFENFEFKLLGCHRLSDILQLLLEEARAHFELAEVSLILVDRDYSIRDLMETLALDVYQNRLQLRHSDEFSRTLYPGEYRVVLGDLDALSASRLFPGLSDLGSAALLPLVRNDQLMASLHFASRSRERFTPEKAVDFMHHLASICAVCLENSLTHEHLQHQSRNDMLTQVSNRMNFDLEFPKELERSERSQEPLTCLFVDADHFKQINDEHGHHVGDVCLKEVAQAIKGQLRKTDLMARYGGEEFVVLLHRCEQEEAQVIAERIRVAVSKLSIAASQNRIRPTVSIGLASWQPVSERTADLTKLGQRLLKTADDAMYEAKDGGRNRVVTKVFCQLVS